MPHKNYEIFDVINKTIAKKHWVSILIDNFQNMTVYGKIGPRQFDAR